MKSFADQCKDHILHLQTHGLNVEELEFNSNGVRCYAIGEDEKARGEFWYKSIINEMQKGKVGIVTNFRSSSGDIRSYKTYGKAPTGEEKVKIAAAKVAAETRKADKKSLIEKATYLFEKKCFECYKAPYLTLKNIKPYGVKCHISDEHGKSVVVPAKNIDGEIVSCQYLNKDGSKSWMKNGEVVGSFHALAPLDKVEMIGICEGYATSATCMSVFEDLSIKSSVVTAFASWNLKNAGLLIRKRYPNAKIIFLSDNDRHLSKNTGLEAARIALKEVGGTSVFLEPRFIEKPPLKEFSDWNDLARAFGINEVRSQILRFLRSEMWL